MAISRAPLDKLTAFARRMGWTFDWASSNGSTFNPDYGVSFTQEELDSGKAVMDEVDIALYDSFAQPESDQHEIRVLVDNPRARRVVIFTWNFHPELVTAARQLGVSGYLSKALTARELVDALEAVHDGEVVISTSAARARTTSSLDWPGRREGLTDREAEILAEDLRACEVPVVGVLGNHDYECGQPDEVTRILH